MNMTVGKLYAKFILESAKKNMDQIKALARKVDPNNDNPTLDNMKDKSMDELNLIRITVSMEIALRVLEDAKLKSEDIIEPSDNLPEKYL